MNANLFARANRFARWRHARLARCARGFTLIEMLVSLAITMIMMGAVVSLFAVITDSVSGSRSLIEMSDRLRACRNRIQADLQGVTVSVMLPPRRPENDEGYLEYIEGPYRDGDYTPSTPNNNVPTILGDADDVLMFTTRSKAEPFVGKYNGTATVESQVAEVAYFAVPNGQILDATTNPNATRLYTLYRRVLIVSPGLRNVAGFPSLVNPNWYDSNDVSAHAENVGGTPTMVPNSLGDLTKRENRFAHFSPSPAPAPLYGFPFNLNTKPSGGIGPAGLNAYLGPMSAGGGAPNPDRTGDDVLMTNVLAFDVQAYDPGVPIYSSSNIALLPSDTGYYNGTNTGAVGGYVDLGYTLSSPPTPAPAFMKPAAQMSIVPSAATAMVLAPTIPSVYWNSLNTSTNLLNPTPSASISNAGTPPSTFTYDTWSLHYEADGINQGAHASADWATNGLDDDGNGIVDDGLELDTQAPFPVQAVGNPTPPARLPGQLRGIRVTVRAYDPSSQQVRQVEVIQDFLPE